MNKIKTTLLVVGMIFSSMVNAGTYTDTTDQMRTCSNTGEHTVFQAKIMRGELQTVKTTQEYDDRITQRMRAAGKDETFIQHTLNLLTKIRAAAIEIGLHNNDIEIHTGAWARCMDGNL